ncbi:methyl-accepting chemotaxis protein [Maritimibacter sp. UBA3975]|uniref:methyl-accepting chemotaxis protein n=1 Tax=Maritimibacter sp. UBA3975 TaxID=1946833 RepID=UPI000C0A8C43|nr:methyl-accepting chemotaxis protein [Maritimibacter sp. UBA3975]MAM60657.1 chemotaxis protein [Maritimibacter sp.]
MRFLNNLSISKKMPIIMVLLVVLSASVSGVLSATKQRKALLDSAQEQLASVVDTRAQLMAQVTQAAAMNLDALVDRPTTIAQVGALLNGVAMLGEEAPERLTEAFVTANPHPAEARAELVEPAAAGLWAYGGAHKVFHPQVRAFAGHYGYLDVYVITPEGQVIYSMNKGPAFTENLATGPFADEVLGRTFAAALANGDAPDRAVGGLFGEHRGAVATFIMQGVAGPDGAVLGYLAIQPDTATLDWVANDPSGLGETGEVFVIGEDATFRTGSRFEGGHAATDPVRGGPQIEAVLAGDTGVEVGTGQDGRPALIAYGPLGAATPGWGVVAEQDMEEILAPARDLMVQMVIQQGLVILCVSVVAFLFSASLARPLRRVTGAMTDISRGELDIEVPDVTRRDEVGQIAGTLEQFRVGLIESRKRAFHGNFRSAAFANSRSAIMMTNMFHEIMHVNKALADMLRRYEDVFSQVVGRFDADEIVGRSVHDYHPPGIRERVEAVLKDPANLPYSADIAFGDVRITLDISAVHDEHGKHIGYVTEWTDVTEGYMNRAILRAMDANQVKAEFAADGTLMRTNDMFTRVVGAPAGPAGSINAISQVSDDLAAAFERAKGGEAVFDRFEWPRGDGDTAIIDGSFAPVTDGNGRLMRVVLVGNDITEATRAMRAAEDDRRAMQEGQARVVDALRGGLESLAEGDLMTRIDDAFPADYEQLRNDFNRAADKLLEAMRGVIENADLITGEASEISSAADDLSARTEKQAATLEETASALDQLTSSVRSAADGAAHANEIVEKARENAAASGEVVREAVGAMGEIETSSTQISKITGVIDDIAFQTNLLALNAGVEAARAGEAGRGFAVVASEVRAPAQRSSDAAREINELISASGGQVKRGVSLVGQAGEALKGIVESVTEISRNVSEIAVSAREQSSGLAEINTAVNQLDQVTQQNAAMFEETTAASHALTREAETLARTMGRFRTGDPAAGAAEPPVDFASRRVAPKPPAAAAPLATQAVAAPVVDDDDGWDEF